jgi:hypothetical protein
VCKFLCGLFKKEKNDETKMTMAKSLNVAPEPMILETPPAIDMATSYTQEETLALAMAFSQRWQQLSGGDGAQVFANITSSDAASPRP